MEILSTGEKIKRARVYQGVTLKELCGDKISISKMSCIENGKIKADDDILRYIAEKLDIKYDYLIQDVEEQILKNIELLKSKSIANEDIKKVIQYNLNFAMEYEYFELAFQLIHKLFRYYMNNNMLDDIQVIISNYYDLFQMNNTIENMLIYYKDMACFFMMNKEYNEAINYYDKILELIEKNKDEEKEEFLNNALSKGICYMNIDEINNAYNIVSKAIEYIDYVQSDEEKGRIYQVFANLNILLNKVETDNYINKAYQYQSNDKVILAMSKGEYGKSYFAVGDRIRAIDQIFSGIEIFKEICSEKYVEYLIFCIDVLYKYKEYDLATELSDEALNLSICSDDVRLIERAYYFKGMILQKKGRFVEAEMYMNLSTDNLFRFASKEERFKRYNEMGELYYNLKELKEAIKYFTLAMNLEKKL